MHQKCMKSGIFRPPPRRPRLGGGPVEGEDRCGFARVLTPTGIVHLCDRPDGHTGGHRGRLLSIRVTDQAITLLGYAVAVAS